MEQMTIDNIEKYCSTITPNMSKELLNKVFLKLFLNSLISGGEYYKIENRGG